MSAFDTLAARYDEDFTQTATGRLQRAVVHAFLEHKIAPCAAVLELNCGTGEDAVWLARRGCRVLATDLSAEMVTYAAAKARAAHLGDNIQTQVLDIRALAADPHLFSERRFDLILSNFGGLNCLSPADMQCLGRVLPALLNPGGCFVAVVMGRFCWWETLYFIGKARPRSAFRRFSAQPVEARLDTFTQVSTWYYTPASFGRFFPDLNKKTVQPVGFWLPPSYLDPWFARWPGLLRGLNFLEKKCRGRLWAVAADHFLFFACS